jgi:5-formyltetrahydrofolate cyclo-ligase
MSDEQHGSETAEAKRLAREQARAARRDLEPHVCAAHAEAVAEHLLSVPELADAHLVLAYNATAEEIDPARAIERLRELGKAVAFPRVESPGILGIHLHAAGDALETGPMGISQPGADAPRVDLASIDAVIVPGVAFDAHGKRLGYGGGFYDRFLPQLRSDCIRIGLAYDEQLVDDLPVAEHDAPVDVVVTPTRVIRTGAAAGPSGPLGELP